MVTFEKINMLLNEMEELIDNGEFEITDSVCSILYAKIKEELSNLAPQCDPYLWEQGFSNFEPIELGKKDKEFKRIQGRFDKLCKSIETPEEFMQGIRDMMFPNGEDYDD